MNDRTTRAKIEIRLELRQLVLLSLGTMAFSGSLFAVGYWLGTRDGLKSVASPTTEIVGVDRTERPHARPRVKPTKAALGEVEFLFAKPNLKKKPTAADRAVLRIATAKADSKVDRRLPKLSARPKAVKPRRVILPELPAVPGRLRGTQVSVTSAKPNQQVLAPSVHASGKTIKGTALVKSPKVLPPKLIPAVSKSVVSRVTPKVTMPKTVPTKAVTPKIAALVSSIDAELREGTGINNSVKPKPATPKEKIKADRTGFIEVTVPKTPTPKPAKTVKRRGPSHYFTVQVKAVTDKGEADSFSASLRARGFKPNVVLANIPEKGRYYRIRVGKFESLDEARRFHKAIKAKGNSDVRGFVTRY